MRESWSAAEARRFRGSDAGPGAELIEGEELHRQGAPGAQQSEILDLPQPGSQLSGERPETRFEDRNQHLGLPLGLALGPSLGLSLGLPTVDDGRFWHVEALQNGRPDVLPAGQLRQHAREAEVCLPGEIVLLAGDLQPAVDNTSGEGEYRDVVWRPGALTGTHRQLRHSRNSARRSWCDTKSPL
jgi:hypothetical protein